MSVDFAHNLFASAVSGAAGMAMFNPLDCLRVRWQVARADAARARTAWRFAAEIARREGLVAGLWRPGLALNTAEMFYVRTPQYHTNQDDKQASSAH